MSRQNLSSQDEGAWALSEAARERLKVAVQESGGPAKVARATGLQGGTLNKILNGKGDVGTARIAAIANACSVSVDYILTGDVTFSNGITLLPVEHQAFSAGDGALPDETGEGVKEHVPFPEEWLRRHFGKVKDLKLITVVGDSMQPDLVDGDWVMIDPARKKGDGIYAIRHHDVLQVKRLIFEVGGVTIRSTNQEKDKDGNLRYREERVVYREGSNDLPFDVVGQVIWTGRKIWLS
jgi:transcriptional regulator with XRE-family HTH domain